MSTTRDPDRLLRAWLDLMPTEAPDRAIAAVLQAAETTRQVRALPRLGRWRFPMNRLTLIATAALVVAALVGGAYLFAGSSNGPAVPTPTAVPPTASPKPEGIVALPEAIWGDWHAEVDSLPSITSVKQPIRLSLAWQDGREAHIQLDGDGQGVQVLLSAPMAAPAGELRFRDVGNAQCAAGDEGTYRWSRSADGLFLTLELIQDDCATRATAFARTWVHSLSAVTDGGVGMIPGNPWIQVTMPKVRLAMSGGTDAADIHAFDASDPLNPSLLAVKDPMGFGAPCATDRKPVAIDPTVAAFETYLGTLPGLQLGIASSTIDGIAARRFDVVAAAAPECPGGDIGLFRSRVPTETDAVWALAPGDHVFLWAIVRDGHLNVFAFAANGATLADGQAIVDTIRFLDVLPTPAP